MEQEEGRQKDLKRIKEILFGEELQGLDSRLEELRGELVNVLENQVKILEEKLQEQKTDYQNLLKSLEKKLEEGKKDRKKLEEALNEARQGSVTALKEKSTEFEHKLNAMAEKLRTENIDALKKLKSELLEELKKTDETKVNKTEIAELFGLMIQKLK